MESIAIVGAGLAGIRAAQTLRGDGFEGRITLIGEEHHQPYDRPPLSKNALAGELAGELGGDGFAGLALVPPEEYAALELDERLGYLAVDLNLAERSVDIQKVDGNGKASDEKEQVKAEAILIATGARPRTLPDTENLKGIYTLRTLDDCQALYSEFSANPKRVAVIGAGFIGCEVAATARGMGLEVSLIEMASAPLELALGKEMGDLVGEIHKENGIDLRVDTKVEALVSDKRVGEKRVEALELTSKSGGDTTLEADVVVVGIGVIPNTDWLEGSGLTIDPKDRGVLCDETCLAAEGVAAAGDVARWENKRFQQVMRVEHWDNAIEQSKAAARRLLAGDDLRSVQPYAPIPWFWSDQYDYKIQLAGLSSNEDKINLVEGSFSERKFTVLYERDGKVRGVLGVNSPRQVQQYRQKIEEDYPI